MNPAISDTVALAATTIWARRAKSALMAIGPACAVTVIVATFGILGTSRARLADQVEQLGSRLLIVDPENALEGSVTELPLDAADTVRGIDTVERVEPMWRLDPSQHPLRWVNSSSNRLTTAPASVHAAGPGLFSLLGLSPAWGVTFDDVHQRESAPVVVLGFQVAQQWRAEGAIPTVTIGDREYLVIGALEETQMAESLNSAAFVPASLAPATEPTRLYVTVLTAPVARATAQFIERVGPIAQPRSAITATIAADAVAAEALISDSVRALTYAIGALVMFVGATAIANVMSLAVMERHAEIGVRKAIGHPPRLITAQVLLEGTIVGLVGGFAGAALGVIVTAVYAQIGDEPLALPLTQLFGAVAAAAVVAAIASLPAARRAARVDPIAALRTG